MHFWHQILILSLLQSMVWSTLCFNKTKKSNSLKDASLTKSIPPSIPKEKQRKASLKDKVFLKTRFGNKKLIWSDTIRVSKPHVYWMRLAFDPKKTVLYPGSIAKSKSKESLTWGPNLPGDVLRLTSLKDNTVQYFNNETLIQWQFRSAFFNGNAVLVELFEDGIDPTLQTKGGSTNLRMQLKSKVKLKKSVHNLKKEEHRSDTALRTLCEVEDRRQPYQDEKIGRIYPSGCTGWLINDREGCMLSAGHCFDSDKYIAQVIQMQVPKSYPYFHGTGLHLYKSAPQHPSPEYQFMIDLQSLQDINKGDEDMAYFGTFRNPNTGLTYKETAQNQTFVLPNETNSEALKKKYKIGTPVRVSGYGITQQETNRDLMLTLQTHVDRISNFEGKHLLEHRVDTEGGNSGSAIVVDQTNIAIGIHIHGHCEFGDPDSSNQAVLVTHPRLQRYLKAPKGVCKPKQKTKGQSKNHKKNQKNTLNVY